jgi:hypothetical protein
MEFAIQWSFVEGLWECVYCDQYSLNKYYGDLLHLRKDDKGKKIGNTLYHTLDCRFIEEWRKLHPLKTDAGKVLDAAVQVALKQPEPKKINDGSILSLLDF